MSKINVGIQVSVKVPEGIDVAYARAIFKEWLKQTINWMDDEIEVDGEVVCKKDQID